jgi:hypothetical protein
LTSKKGYGKTNRPIREKKQMAFLTFPLPGIVSAEGGVVKGHFSPYKEGTEGNGMADPHSENKPQAECPSCPAAA